MAEIKISDADVYRYAHFVAGHPDAEVDARHLAATRAVLDGLAQDGRLLPSGGEEQYRIVWSGQEGTYVDGEIDDLQDGLDHLAIIRGLSFVKEAHLERRILTDWSPVVSDNSEVPNAG